MRGGGTGGGETGEGGGGKGEVKEEEKSHMAGEDKMVIGIDNDEEDRKNQIHLNLS